MVVWACIARPPVSLSQIFCILCAKNVLTAKTSVKTICNRLSQCLPAYGDAECGQGIDLPAHLRCILKDALCKDAENFQNSEMLPFVGIVKGKRIFPLTTSFVTFLCGQKSKCRQAKLFQRIGIGINR